MVTTKGSSTFLKVLRIFRIIFSSKAFQLLFFMKFLSLRAFSLLAGSALLLASCSKKEDPAPVNPVAKDGSIQMRFAPTMDGQPVVMDTKTYTNAAGETFNVTFLKYFVSNFSLLKEGSDVPTPLPPSYFLVDAANLRTVSIANVPAGSYTKISFMIGVDSLHNVSGLQEGDLDPAGRAKGMYWDWSAGYIQAKMEGRSPQSSLVDSSVFFHIGGFDGQYSPLRTVTLTLPTPLVVEEGKTPTLQIQSDLGSWFAGPPALRFADQGQIMTPGKESITIADGYAKGFKVVQVAP